MDRDCSRCQRTVNVSGSSLDEPYVCVPCRNKLCVHSFEVYDFGHRARCVHCGEDITVDQMRALQGLPLLTQEAVNHPSHYGGKDNPYEAIKVIRAWKLGFCLGNTVKYIARAGKKDPKKLIEDLEKARWYLDEEIASLKEKP